MAQPAITPPETQEHEIARLVNLARAEGEKDVFSGKRRWTRYTLPMRLEVSTDPGNPDATWQATMHNISGGGFGFWSKHMLREGVPLFVREWSRRNSSDWLAAHTTHCTIGIRGHLVGATFDRPAAADVAEDSKSVVPVGMASARLEAARATGLRWSLRIKCVACAGLAGGLGVLVAGFALRSGWPGSFPVAPAAFAAGLAIIFGGLAGLIMVDAELRFLKSLHMGLSQIAKGEAINAQLTSAPSKELAATEEAFFELALAWQKHQEDERLARQKLEELNQMKSNILSIVSHDLRTPLTSILLYAQMLTEELRTLEEEDQRRFLGIISDECTRLARLVDDLLEIQRLEAGRTRWDMQSRDLSQTIRSCAVLFEAMALSKDMTLSVDCPETLPSVEADADKISQVLSNLLSNAIKYTPTGGSVRLAAHVNGKDIVMSVADSGPGIPRDKWDQIFDRFLQLANPNVREIAGCGLGLYIVRQIVERHGGAVWVDSEVGKGSEFFVSLPTRVPRSAARVEPAEAPTAGRVLVCDADPELAAMVSQTLRQEKYDVRQAHSGRRLLSQLQQGDCDVVVTDLLLSDIHAEELLKALTTMERRSYGLVVHSYAGDGPELRRRGVDVFLGRPASRDDLLQAVQVALPQRRHSASSSRLVLLIECERMHMKRFGNVLTEAGHLVMMTNSVDEAGPLIDNYPTDIVLACAEALGAEWRELELLRLSERDNLFVVVVCENVRQQERQWADYYGVSVVASRRGHEGEVVAAIIEAHQERAKEYAA